ncbi:MAG TPA: DUF3108 domain-containing protein [Luteimonas sp.]|nr:DUF3108 domain-containing protein [Luteimonas sp.]
MQQQTRHAAVLVAAMLALASTPALAVAPFAADYQATYMGMQAAGTMTLAPAGADRWTYSLDIDGMGAQMKQSTVFEAKGNAWRPLSSSDSQQGTAGLAAMLVKKKSVNAQYDWSKGEARWTGDVDSDKAGPVKLQAGDLDGMLMNLALVRDVAAGKPLDYRLVEDGKIKQQSFKVAGKESVDVGGKSREATKVVRQDGKREIIAWVVEGLPVPARILQRRDGRDHVDLRLSRVR